MRKLFAEADHSLCTIQRLTSGVDLFKVEMGDCVFEAFRGRTGEWRILYHSPDCRDMSADDIGNLIEAQLLNQQ